MQLVVLVLISAFSNASLLKLLDLNFNPARSYAGDVVTAADDNRCGTARTFVGGVAPFAVDALVVVAGGHTSPLLPLRAR
jgi:hypothetical protein